MFTVIFQNTNSLLRSFFKVQISSLGTVLNNMYDSYYRCDSTKKLQSKLKSLKNLIDDPAVFKKMYRFAFDFCRVC